MNRRQPKRNASTDLVAMCNYSSPVAADDGHGRFTPSYTCDLALAAMGISEGRVQCDPTCTLLTTGQCGHYAPYRGTHERIAG